MLGVEVVKSDYTFVSPAALDSALLDIYLRYFVLISSHPTCSFSVFDVFSLTSCTSCLQAIGKV